MPWEVLEAQPFLEHILMSIGIFSSSLRIDLVLPYATRFHLCIQLLQLINAHNNEKIYFDYSHLLVLVCRS